MSFTGASLTAVRLPGLDALRAIAMLLGVVVHACVPYSATGLDGLLWVIPTSQTSRLCEVLLWGIHAFRLPLFFLLSGYFSELLFRSRGPAGFARQRVVRLVVPYYVGMVTILPISLLVWVWGWTINGQTTWSQALNPFEEFAPNLQAHYFGPAHLWFLSDLSLITLCYGLLRWNWNPRPPDSRHSWLIRVPSLLLPALLAVPPALCLWDDLSTYTAHHNSFVPHAVRAVYFAWYFVLGVQLFHCPQLLCRLVAPWKALLVLALLSMSLLVTIVPQHQQSPFGEPGLFLLACVVSCTGCYALFGLVGLAFRWRPQANICRYLADSSYWIYLCHLPIVGLGQLMLRTSPLSPAVKILLITGGTAILGLLSYHMCVRYTCIGAVLHGPRGRRVAAASTPSEPASPPQPSDASRDLRPPSAKP